MIDTYNNKSLQGMLKREKETKFYALECIKFYNNKIDQYDGASLYYIGLRDYALNKVVAADIQIDYLERTLFEE